MITVENYFSMIFLSWTAPFTLYTSDTEPDITYCVDAVNSSSAETLHSECEINMTEFTYLLPPSVGCGGILFTVTPVNAVGNGTTQTTFFLIQKRKTSSTINCFICGNKMDVGPEVLQWNLTAKLTLSLIMASSKLQ